MDCGREFMYVRQEAIKCYIFSLVDKLNLRHGHLELYITSKMMFFWSIILEITIRDFFDHNGIGLSAYYLHGSVIQKQ